LIIIKSVIKLVVVKCRECGKEYALSDNENPSNFACECGGTLSPKIKRVPKEAIKETKYCSNCASEIDVKAEICPNCGVRQQVSKRYQQEEKSLILSLILSFFISGAGQIYNGLGQANNGQIEKGIILFIGYLICWALSFLIIPAFILFGIWIFGMYDAYTTAKKINAGEPVKK